MLYKLIHSTTYKLQATSYKLSPHRQPDRYSERRADFFQLLFQFGRIDDAFERVSQRHVCLQFFPESLLKSGHARNAAAHDYFFDRAPCFVEIRIHDALAFVDDVVYDEQEFFRAVKLAWREIQTRHNLLFLRFGEIRMGE